MPYIVAVQAQYSQTDRLKTILGQCVLEPAIRIPFSAFLSWLKLLIYEREFEIAEEMIQDYVQSSTHLLESQESKNDS